MPPTLLPLTLLHARGAAAVRGLMRWGHKALQWQQGIVRLLGARLRGGRVAVAATSMDLALDPVLSRLLGVRPVYFCRLLPVRPRLILGWGNRRSGRRARALRDRADGLLLVEDGFLRSVGRRDPPLSLVFDRGGIHYDADSDSDLFGLIARPLDPAQDARARGLIHRWRALGLSKYNARRDCAVPPEPYVLVVDQVAGDLSIAGGGADAATFPRMLMAALRENPGLRVVVKLHPDSLSDPGRRHFDPEALRALPRVTVLACDGHIAPLIAGARAVYVATSQVGFEALIHGRRVRCFGRPFYAGWGLTEDEGPRRGTADLAQLVHAALVDYPRYCHPETGAETTPERAMDHAGLQRALRAAFPARLYAVGFPRRKRPILRRFLQGSQVRFLRHPHQVPPGATAVLWGSRSAEGLPSSARVLRVEDGFLRSAGLGAELVPPLSWVIDDLGIHYDPAQPSRLERILQDSVLDQAARQRARALRDLIVTSRVTKYNLPGDRWTRPPGAVRVILVPGQVESDASIRCGAPDIRTNLDLLRRVRAAAPAAHILYKPHPDVVGGLRDAGADESLALRFCDEVLDRASAADLLDQVDEVHTLTSLLGFEALLRGLPVTCHGQPFYAGWGLTTDRVPIPRRGRRLDLDHLIHGALIAYPRYVSGRTGLFTTPERTVRDLVQWRDRAHRRGRVGRLLRGRWRWRGRLVTRLRGLRSWLWGRRT